MLAQALGITRAVIPHVDDLGATHGANQAFLHLARRGLVTCGSVIVPGPAFDEIVGEADPALDLLPAHVRLGEEYRLWPVLPRSICWAPDPAAYQAAVAALDAAGRPVADHCHRTLAAEADALAPGWRALMETLPPGVAHLALHATMPGDFAAIAPDHAGWRFREHGWLAGGGLSALCDASGIALLGCRAV